ncbi:MAG: hypothetical protein HY530_01410 [Chloroflexi bacterium]|nr:hypothetical protein [Chloroflexota bacterium]
MDSHRGIKLKTLIVWLGLLLVSSFWLTARTSSDQVSLAVVPEVPREGEPVVATFKLSNPMPEAEAIAYQFYVNGEPVQEGAATVPGGSSKVYQYAYRNPLLLGQQVNFMVKTVSPRGSYESVVSLPSYPPQVWSSFVSFASFSTSMMSVLTTMAYYQTSFGTGGGLNVGILITVVLIALLIFLELTLPLLRERTFTILGVMRLRFSMLTWILLIILMGIVYTKVLIILAAI